MFAQVLIEQFGIRYITPTPNIITPEVYEIAPTLPPTIKPVVVPATIIPETVVSNVSAQALPVTPSVVTPSVTPVEVPTAAAPSPILAGFPIWGWILLVGAGLFLIGGKRIKSRTKSRRRR